MFEVGDKVVRKVEYQGTMWKEDVYNFFNSTSMDIVLTVKKISLSSIFFEEFKIKYEELGWDVYRFELYHGDTSIDDWL